MIIYIEDEEDDVVYKCIKAVEVLSKWYIANTLLNIIQSEGTLRQCCCYRLRGCILVSSYTRTTNYVSRIRALHGEEQRGLQQMNKVTKLDWRH
jgi:hypothetical protein